ncbi:Pycsar system effector family protein [Winogradskya humida]|uniref:Pycsar effector protein domain-containing protein n=1 Tax=Winogradskya humida TaxID=113566 RepID=A0ABQ3ZU60_9ACTN|nr:Pycsar system effector family protein [Actinoplanes humidus]GIE22131.1 hypothetical protein Ahu01nite_052330 [Actinoplanes humidus]
MSRRLNAASSKARRSENTVTAINEVQAHMGRVDTKASILFGFSLAALTGGGTVLAKAHLPIASSVLAVIAAGALVSALALLGAAIRPALGGNHGFVRFAAAESPEQLAADLADIENVTVEYRAEQLLWLSRAVQRKYRRVRLSVDLLMTGLSFAVLAALIAIAF